MLLSFTSCVQYYAILLEVETVRAIKIHRSS